MGMNSGAVIIPGRGAVFTAPPGTTAPNYKTITPAAPGTSWSSLGHTSKENSVSLSKEGGDVTQYDSWWEDALAVTRGSNSWNITVNALQIDKGTLDLAFGGSIDAADKGYIVPSNVIAVDRAIFILAMQGTVRMGLYLPKVSISLGDAPTFDPESMFEVPLAAAVLSSDNVLMKWYHPALEV